jgi:hypothetical protein
VSCICFVSLRLSLKISAWIPDILGFRDLTQFFRPVLEYHLWQDGREDGDRVPVNGKNFLFPTPSRQTLRLTQSLIQYIPRTLSSGVKLPAREADHSPPTSAYVKKTWILTPTPPYAFVLKWPNMQWDYFFYHRCSSTLIIESVFKQPRNM